jgi:DNA-binding XRE family transcriptional regulator
MLRNLYQESQVQFANRLRTTTATLIKWEAGDHQPQTQWIVKLIGHCAPVEADELVDVFHSALMAKLYPAQEPDSRIYLLAEIRPEPFNDERIEAFCSTHKIAEAYDREIHRERPDVETVIYAVALDQRPQGSGARRRVKIKKTDPRPTPAPEGSSH